MLFLFVCRRVFSNLFFSNLVIVKLRGFIAFSALCPSMDDDGGCARYGEGMAVVAGGVSWLWFRLVGGRRWDGSSAG